MLLVQAGLFLEKPLLYTLLLLLLGWIPEVVVVQQSNSNARKGTIASLALRQSSLYRCISGNWLQSETPVHPFGAGMRVMIVSNICSIPCFAMAEVKSTSRSSKPVLSSNSRNVWLTSSSFMTKSILVKTGIIYKPCSTASLKCAIVCACNPWRTSISSSTPSEACRLRDTSYWKSTWPGVSIKLIKYRSYNLSSSSSFAVTVVIVALSLLLLLSLLLWQFSSVQKVVKI